MSATDPLKRRQADRGAMRAVEPQSGERPARRRRPLEFLRCTFRPAGADFYCWKYGVWYNLMDCCYRHFNKTYSGCDGCGQGASNLKANKDRYHSIGHLGVRPRFGR